MSETISIANLPTGTPSTDDILVFVDRADGVTKRADWSEFPAAAGDVTGPASSINNNVVTFNGTTGKVIKDSGLTLSGINTGDQTSIVGITGTKAQFDTAVTDGNIAYTDVTTLSSLVSVGTITTGTWNATDIAVADGGTGRSTGTTAYSLIATGTTATGAQQTLASGATTEVLVGGGASALPVWTTATGSGAPVRATSPTLVTPVLGTPSSGTLTNCTGLPVAGITSSTSIALGVGSLEVGHASDTTIARVSAGVIAVEGVTVPTISSTSTLTNKRITKRVFTETTSSAPLIQSDSYDLHTITALASNPTFGAPSGTPTEGQQIMYRIKDNGTARTLSWNAIYRAMGTALPTTTVLSKTLYVGFIYNATDTKWDLIASAQEA